MGSLGAPREIRRQFWLLIRSGLERRKAAMTPGGCSNTCEGTDFSQARCPNAPKPSSHSATGFLFPCVNRDEDAR